MELVPCAKCRRHVAADAAVCPFCDATVVGTPRRLALVGRVSRAAVFAGATSLVGGCYTTAPGPQGPPPPPPDDQRYVQEQPPPPPPPDDTPPPDDQRYAQPPAGTASITGVVTSSGHPMRMRVTLQRPDGSVDDAVTDPQGRFAFQGLDAGNYLIVIPRDDVPRHPRQGPPAPFQRAVQVANGASLRVDIALPPVASPPIDRGPCCKPYGAPPARRRVV